jgi:hypothetical protein
MKSSFGQERTISISIYFRSQDWLRLPMAASTAEMSTAKMSTTASEGGTVMEPGAAEAMRVEGMPLEAAVIKVSPMIEIPTPAAPPGTIRRIVAVAWIAVASIMVAAVCASSQANHRDKGYC